MSWALFCQIEVILLTVGLVVSFVLHSYRRAKDDSFNGRIVALGKALEELSKTIANEGKKLKSKVLEPVDYSKTRSYHEWRNRKDAEENTDDE